MAITELYVSTAGGGAHDGTSEANAFTFAEMVTDINARAPAAAAYRYNIKQGTYSLAADVTLTGDGTTAYPLILRGYKTTIGDATIGRLATGALDDSNMPTLAFAATKALLCSGSTYIVYEALKITGNCNTSLMNPGACSTIYNCVLENSSTGASAHAVFPNSNYVNILCNDLSAVGTSATCGISTGQSWTNVYGNRIKCTNGYGVLGYSSSTTICVGNTIYGCAVAGIYQYDTSTFIAAVNNTIYGCGNGIEVVTGTTNAIVTVGNHITDCTGYAIDYNGITSKKIAVRNRTRDNASGATDSSSEWVNGGWISNVTTDTGDASTDYTNAGSSDFSLIAAAPALTSGIGVYIPIGANGSVHVAAGGMKGWASA